jgi:hypothetical protein
MHNSFKREENLVDAFAVSPDSAVLMFLAHEVQTTFVL